VGEVSDPSIFTPDISACLMARPDRWHGLDRGVNNCAQPDLHDPNYDTIAGYSWAELDVSPTSKTAPR
jgi:hypothetical protein